MFVRVTDYADRLVGGLLYQFRSNERMVALLRHVVGPQLQALEDVFWKMIDGLDVDQAPSALLDQLGELVGQPRKGESDAMYRRKIRARQARNRSRGRIEDLIVVARLLLPDKLLAVGGVHVAEVGTHEVAIALHVSTALTADEEATVAEFLAGSKQGGVRVVGICWRTGPTFSYNGSTATGFAGYDDGTGTVGGAWAKYFYP